MAFKHRKLYPTLASTNETTNCSGYCDPACPDNCYPYSDVYYSPPPPLTPPPTAADHPGNSHISPHMIVLISALIGSFLLLASYIIVRRARGGCCGSSEEVHDPSQTDGTEEEFFDENRAEHHIWFITTVGLQPSIINSITVCKFKKGEGLIEGTECSVCLSEFKEDETLRILPKCSHAFHISCIDTWLRSHTNCPLCRAQIVVDNGIADVARASLVSARQGNENPRGNEENQIEISEINTGLGEIGEVSVEEDLQAGLNSSSSETKNYDDDDEEQERRQVLMNPSSESGNNMAEMDHLRSV